MTKEEKLIEFIRKTSEDACLICESRENIEDCESVDYDCQSCKEECPCRDCRCNKSFVFDEKRLDEKS